MEQSISSLAFKGSIQEAIAEAKQQKKLFVVYTGGKNEKSELLETSTWIDPNVSEALSKYCIFLHLLEGSLEASNFSVIYSQPAAPCITVVGYNGVQLWQKAGFVTADELASSLEKAWLSLHFQETTAAFLTAALAAGKKVVPETIETEDRRMVNEDYHDGSTSTSSEQGAAGTSATMHSVLSSEQGSPGTSAAMQSTDAHFLVPNGGQPSHLTSTENSKNLEDGSNKADVKKVGTVFPENPPAEVLDATEPTFKSETINMPQEPMEMSQSKPEVVSPSPEKNLDLCADSLGNNDGVTQLIANDTSEAAKVKDREYPLEVEKAESSDSSAIKSNDLFLSIKLPDGSSLQAKFSVTDSLKMVKNYIAQTSSLTSFSIAIPYPRKIFSEPDLDSTLSELGLLNRQALVVVSHNPNTSNYVGGASGYQTNSSAEPESSNTNEGYWGFLRRVVSYANPLSYLSRSPNSESASQVSEGGMWQYGPNPALQNTLRHGGIPSSNQTPGGTIKKRQKPSGFGSNIHTLRQDENDDGRFNDRNAFWNGNSTQYGGDNNSNDGK